MFKYTVKHRKLTEKYIYFPNLRKNFGFFTNRQMSKKNNNNKYISRTAFALYARGQKVSCCNKRLKTHCLISTKFNRSTVTEKGTKIRCYKFARLSFS